MRKLSAIFPTWSILTVAKKSCCEEREREGEFSSPKLDWFLSSRVVIMTMAVRTQPACTPRRASLGPGGTPDTQWTSEWSGNSSLNPQSLAPHLSLLSVTLILICDTVVVWLSDERITPEIRLPQIWLVCSIPQKTPLKRLMVASWSWSEAWA